MQCMYVLVSVGFHWTTHLFNKNTTAKFAVRTAMHFVRMFAEDGNCRGSEKFGTTQQNYRFFVGVKMGIYLNTAKKQPTKMTIEQIHDE